MRSRIHESDSVSLKGQNREGSHMAAVQLAEPSAGNAVHLAPAVRTRRRRLKGLMRDKLGLFSLAMIVLLIITAIAAPVVSPADPYKINPKGKFQPPSRQHLMGTDEMGRDILSRVIYGARISIGISLAVTIGGVALGVFLGAVAALAEGLLGEVIMRITDIFLAVPVLVLAMAITAALGPSMVNAAIAMVLVWWPGYTRQARAEFLRVKPSLYVEAARSIGAPPLRLVLRHILPNSIDPILVRMTTTIGYIMLTTAALSFIGLGSRPPTPDWGTMIAIGRAYLVSIPWYPLLVGLPLFLTVLFFGLAGDAIQDAIGIRLQEN
jgi:peptide/nickel transport system permease protein